MSHAYFQQWMNNVTLKLNHANTSVICGFILVWVSIRVILTYNDNAASLTLS